MAVGGIQRVFTEFLTEFCHSFLDGGITRLGLALKFCPTQHKVSQGVFKSLLLGRIQRLSFDAFVLGIQAFVGTQARPELGHPGQGFGVGGAQPVRQGGGGAPAGARQQAASAPVATAPATGISGSVRLSPALAQRVAPTDSVFVPAAEVQSILFALL